MKKSSNNSRGSTSGGISASKSAKNAIGLLTKSFGANTGGIIAIDTKGRFGVSANTGLMPVAMKSSTDDDNKAQVVFLEQNRS
jgi:isoaspartyl peptidase/L-asparaginase-like protein (Ntn-hydrolase superfamily)